MNANRTPGPLYVFPLEEAVAYLHYLIRKGVEYPDAEYRASVKFDVDAGDLRTEYDGCQS